VFKIVSKDERFQWKREFKTDKDGRKADSTDVWKLRCFSKVLKFDFKVKNVVDGTERLVSNTFVSNLDKQLLIWKSNVKYLGSFLEWSNDLNKWWCVLSQDVLDWSNQL
jgi:hypothetical protein